MDGLNNLIATAGNYQAPDFDKGAQNALALQAGEMKLEDEKILRPMKNEMATMSYFRDMVPSITAGNYQQVSQHLMSRGVPAHVFPDFNQFVDAAIKENVHPEVKVREWANRVGMTIDQKLKEDMQAERLKSAVDLTGHRIESAEKISRERISAAEKLAEARDKQLRELVDIKAKHAAELAELKASLQPEKQKYSKEDILISDSLRERLGREPTAQEIISEKQAIAKETSAQKRSHVLPEKAMENMNGALDSMRLIDELAGVADEAMGIPGLGQAKMWLKSKAGSERAQLFLNNLRQLKINAQSLIKGIPSNFDVQTFINSLPKEDDTPKEVKTKVEIARKMLEDALITGMQNYEKQFEIPEYMRQRYEASNIKGSLKPAGNKENTIGRFKIEVE